MTKEMAISTFVAAVESTAKGVPGEDLQSVLILLTGPAQVPARPQVIPCHTVASPGATRRRKDSYITKHIAGMPTVELKIPLDLLLPL